MKREGRKPKDLKVLEKRRRRAARLFKKKKKQADIARLLGVSRQSVSRWYEQWSEGGKEALKSAGQTGRPPKLSGSQLKAIENALLEGARAHGFNTDLWTLKRVAKVIESLTGISFTIPHVWWVLRNKMGWSLHRPAKRARERNEERVRIWREETWPRVKKKPSRKGAGSSSKTKAASRKSRRSGGPGGRKGKRQS